MEHRGGCHCGNITLTLRLARPPRETPLRACACTFCRAHGTRTAADPDGSAEIAAGDLSLVEFYRFGSKTADYVLCRRCGVYVGAVCDTAAGTRAVINVNALNDREAFTAMPSVNDYDSETTDARLVRRAVRWMPATVRR
jgi:hypothetical protein